MNKVEIEGTIDKESKPFRLSDLVSSSLTASFIYDIEFNGRIYSPRNRVTAPGNTIQFVRYFDDFPVQQLTNFWIDTVGELNKEFVVQLLL